MFLRASLAFILLTGGSAVLATTQVPPEEKDLIGDHGDPFGGNSKVNCTGPTSYTDSKTGKQRWMYSHPTNGSKIGFIDRDACRRAMDVAGCR